VAAYGAVMTGGLAVGLVKLTDIVRSCSSRAGRGTGAAGGVRALPCRGKRAEAGGSGGRRKRRGRERLPGGTGCIAREPTDRRAWPRKTNI
jgi:hypothetical protein